MLRVGWSRHGVPGLGRMGRSAARGLDHGEWPAWVGGAAGPGCRGWPAEERRSRTGRATSPEPGRSGRQLAGLPHTVLARAWRRFDLAGTSPPRASGRHQDDLATGAPRRPVRSAATSSGLQLARCLLPAHRVGVSDGPPSRKRAMPAPPPRPIPRPAAAPPGPLCRSRRTAKPAAQPPRHRACHAGPAATTKPAPSRCATGPAIPAPRRHHNPAGPAAAPPGAATSHRCLMAR